MIPTLSDLIGGATSIDITRPGIDKGYGVRKLREILGIAINSTIFVGDGYSPVGTTIRPSKQV